MTGEPRAGGSSSPPGPTLGPTERTPSLSNLVREADLRRVLSPFVAGRIDGVAVFAADGSPFVVASTKDAPFARWEQLPVEAQQAVRNRTPAFGIEDHAYEVRPLYAGADRVAYLIVARAAGDADGLEAVLAEALGHAVGQLLQAGFAAWVTSEMHLAVSAKRHLEIAEHNAELQRAVEHLREIDKLKSNFLATVSHELRTPLTSVIGFSEMLLEGIAGDLNEEQREYVQTIFSRGEELLRLITQVLEMSQLEVGAVRLDMQTHSASVLANKAVEAVRLAADAAGISLTVEVPDLPEIVCDAEKLLRVLTNLVGNAIKFSSQGATVRVLAEAAPIRRPFDEETLFGEEAADAVRFSVIDTGRGIAADQLTRVFEAFYQADAGPTREHGGAGLGLSIVKSLVTAHGGDVWADSVLGEGTRVHFTVPLSQAGLAETED
ncbi:MAG: HAMP domain-containing histidine kinase [Nannocystaceae bacterium]|nr:HAMP domain-containing histidine kinase [Nannocystaceae bacterium]